MQVQIQKVVLTTGMKDKHNVAASQRNFQAGPPAADVHENEYGTPMQQDAEVFEVANPEGE